ncbi:MAG: methionyl-tRNA formyltransferase [Sorangiineae bacterium]|nr:methionyl-tRNA formyltransferase [Polyangiaceae bacterium]MEB2323933.1 methionyl-tRNA formyltransferase [Sorangiineae bacterium]
MRAVFFGTPAIATPALRALGELAELVGVVCQPDRRAGRGLKLTEPAVKQLARELGAEVYQPEKVRTGELRDWLRAREADVALVMAYGRILPEDVLAAPRRGSVNLHASLLPRYRGAAPIQWAIIRGETETGISLMQMDVGLDSGPVFARRAIPIGPEETAGELAERLATLAAEVVRDTLPAVVAGTLAATPQDESAATFAPLLGPDDTRLDFGEPARRVVDRIRGLSPRPGARTTLGGKRLLLHAARLDDEPVAGPPGSVGIGSRRQVLVATGAGSVELVRVQLEGRTAVPAEALIHGRALRAGDVLGSRDT